MTMAKPTLEELRARVQGQTIAVGDADYDAARKVYNGMIDRHPHVIVRCVDAADVMAGVDFARENGLESVGPRRVAQRARIRDQRRRRLVIDLSPMNGVRVDPNRADRAR